MDEEASILDREERLNVLEGNIRRFERSYLYLQEESLEDDVLNGVLGDAILSVLLDLYQERKVLEEEESSRSLS